MHPGGERTFLRRTTGERGSTLVETAVATAIAGMVALAVAGAFRASIEAQERQLNRVRWQREVETAVEHAADVLRRAGDCLSPDRSAIVDPDWTATKVTVAYTARDPVTHACRDAAYQRDHYTTVTLEVNGGALWETTVDYRTGQAPVTTARQVAGFARPGGAPGTTVLNDADTPLFEYWGPGPPDPITGLLPSPVTPAEIRRVTVSLALDGDGDGVEDDRGRVSVSLWNRP